MNHPAPTMGQNHQNEQNPKSRGGHGKEIDRDQIVHVIVEERLPSLRRRSTLSGQESRHGSFRDVDTQLQQLAVDAGRSPKRVGSGHLQDQSSNLRAGFWTSALPPGNPAPKQAKALAMPGHDRLRSTMINTQCQSFQLLDSHTRKKRSVPRSRRRGHFGLNTASC